MDYDELTIFASGFLTASVFTWIVALLMPKREKPPCSTRFTGDDIAMLNRLLDENNVQLTKRTDVLQHHQRDGRGTGRGNRESRLAE